MLWANFWVSLCAEPQLVMSDEQFQMSSWIGAAEDSQDPIQGPTEYVKFSSRELLDPSMMSKAYVVGRFLGDFMC